MNPLRFLRVASAVTLSFAAALAFAGCGGDEAGGGPGGGFERPPTAVEVATVQSGPVADEFSTVGTIEASEAVTIVSEVDGIVRELPFREGDEIGRGALIARLEDDERVAELLRAEAVLEQRKSSWERVRNVVEQGAGAAQDLDDARAALQVAKADVDLAKARLAKTRIVAPFSGVVGPRDPSPGAFLRAGAPIVELARVSEMEVTFSVPERYAAELNRDAEVTVSTPAWPGYRVTGRVHVVDPNVDPRTRAVRVIARLPNPDRRFLPGMSANVSAVLAQRASAVTIPAEAVFAEGDQFLAYAVQDDGTVLPVPVKLGTRLAGAVEVLEGLEPGGKVVRAGHQKLYPGAKVMAVNSQELAGDAAPAGDGSADGAAPEGAAPADAAADPAGDEDSQASSEDAS